MEKFNKFDLIGFLVLGVFLFVLCQLFQGDPGLEIAFLGGFGKFVGKIGKGAFKIGKKIVEKTPVGAAISVGIDAFKGSGNRQLESAQIQAENERIQQQSFQATQNTGNLISAGFGTFLSSPLFLVGAAGLLVFLFVKK